MGDSLKKAAENKEKKQSKKSSSYALKAFKTHAETLKVQELITEAEEASILAIYKKAAEKHIKQEYGL